ncbi:chondroitinase-B domain-containing protein [Flammeovirgaceae bacterium SG7u.111]|nr:chondroitinase-B domain-containing protein [Flammeovirgaceae bacterium SG7u.132]WPO38164.1 chondroitinase-B domain-containing protein [Flammeovirgaceae bacterium SG7u.111]
MNNRLVFLLFIISLLSCAESSIKPTIQVSNSEELTKAILNAKPGDEIIMANGDWDDISIRFSGKGTKQKPITLRAETLGGVIVQGKSDLKLSGEYLVVDGLVFTNGYSTSRATIEFAIKDSVANYCQVTNCVIKDFNKPQRNMTDLWVLFKGRHNQLSHCYIAGKSNRGPTVRVDLAGNESINNHHKIIYNHFGPRPPKGGPSAETIQLGNSFTSMAPSYTLVAHNLFDRCNGEVEVISSKTNFNEFRNNVFYKSEGSLVTRHGNYCIVDGNYFIGDDKSEHMGGVRLIGTGHWVTNNYFYNLKGKIFRSPLAVMNGIPKSPLNRYLQVTDVVIAHNSWVNCVSPLQFGVGSNIDEKEVLPASEIRSARPIRTVFANNLIYNNTGDSLPIVAHDQLDGIDFKSNIINNQGVGFDPIDGLMPKPFELTKLEENVWVPEALPKIELYVGFEFDQISKDLFGTSRTAHNTVGAINGRPSAKPEIMQSDKYGPDWYIPTPPSGEPQTHSVTTPQELTEAVSAAKDGDIIELEGGTFEVGNSLKIDKTLTIQSKDLNNKSTILYVGEVQTPAFEMNPKGQLILKGIGLKGEKTQYAFASLKSNMSSLYNLSVIDCEVSNFDFLLKAYKYSFAEHLTFKGSVFKNSNNGLELSEETDDKGEYNAENIVIENCHFERIDKNVVDYYRGGYDESTIGGNLSITNSTFSNCGSKEENGILLNTYGIINVDISGNKFLDNKVKLVAQLWGAKNNSHSNNEIINSGKILVEHNLKLNLLY